MTDQVSQHGWNQSSAASQALMSQGLGSAVRRARRVGKRVKKAAKKVKRAARSVKKIAGKMKKGSAAAKAWGKKMKRLRKKL